MGATFSLEASLPLNDVWVLNTFKEASFAESPKNASKESRAVGLGNWSVFCWLGSFPFISSPKTNIVSRPGQKGRTARLTSRDPGLEDRFRGKLSGRFFCSADSREVTAIMEVDSRARDWKKFFQAKAKRAYLVLGEPPLVGFKTLQIGNQPFWGALTKEGWVFFMRVCEQTSVALRQLGFPKFDT